MATVVNVPKDTRFENVGGAAVKGLATFMSNRKEKKLDEEQAELQTAMSQAGSIQELNKLTAGASPRLLNDDARSGSIDALAESLFPALSSTTAVGPDGQRQTISYDQRVSPESVAASRGLTASPDESKPYGYQNTKSGKLDVLDTSQDTAFRQYEIQNEIDNGEGRMLDPTQLEALMSIEQTRATASRARAAAKPRQDEADIASFLKVNGPQDPTGSMTADTVRNWFREEPQFLARMKTQTTKLGPEGMVALADPSMSNALDKSVQTGRIATLRGFTPAEADQFGYQEVLMGLANAIPIIDTGDGAVLENSASKVAKADFQTTYGITYDSFVAEMSDIKTLQQIAKIPESSGKNPRPFLLDVGTKQNPQQVQVLKINGRVYIQ
jgi:hypothetical protein